MNKFSRQIFIVMLLLVVSTPLCFARSDGILSGRDLLRVVREKDGHKTRVAYANQPAETTKHFSNNSQYQTPAKTTKEKPVKTTSANYTKGTEYTGTQSTLVSDVNNERADNIPGVDITVHKLSEKTARLSDLTSETPFNEAIHILRNSVDPPLNIVVFWQDLEENAGIVQTTPINMDGVSAVPLGTVLELLLESVSSGFSELGYIVEDGVIIIATKESLPRNLEARVYDVTDLLGRRSDFRDEAALFNMLPMVGRFPGYGRYGGYEMYGGYRGPRPIRRGYYGSSR